MAQGQMPVDDIEVMLQHIFLMHIPLHTTPTLPPAGPKSCWGVAILKNAKLLLGGVVLNSQGPDISSMSTFQQ